MADDCYFLDFERRKRKKSEEPDIIVIDKKSRLISENNDSSTEDLDYAIALSLQEQETTITNDSRDDSCYENHNNSVVTLEKGEESDYNTSHNDHDLDHAIALSLQEQDNQMVDLTSPSIKKHNTKHDLVNHTIDLWFTSPIRKQSSTLDLDRTLALQLQEKEEKEHSSRLLTQSWDSKTIIDPKSIIDPRLELEDPHPNVHDLFIQFDALFFDRALVNGGVVVQWGPRMTRCAGLCCYEGRGGLCSIRLSEPLLKLRPRKDLVETLLHEMIHALLFVTFNNRDREGHGPQFLSHMNRINKLTGTNITVYHSFHDEVSLYQQHWWKCDGPCQHRKPYYGTVRRAVNRAPSKNDHWWAEHQFTCGGKFIKIKEPEGYSSKKNKKKKTPLPGEVTLTGTQNTKPHTSATNTHAGSNKTLADTIWTHIGTTGTCTDDTKNCTNKTHSGIPWVHIGSNKTCTDNTKTHTNTTGTGTGAIDLTIDSVEDEKKRRENMLKAAEERLIIHNNRGKSKDIRKFMSPPQETRIVLDSTPTLFNKTPPVKDTLPIRDTPSIKDIIRPLNRECEKRTCPVCGRDDIPLATINAHITFCLEEMEYDSSDSDD